MALTTNIVVGLQSTNTMKIGNYGDNEATAIDVGLIKGGVHIEYEEAFHDVKIDQAIGSIDKITTDETLKVKTTLAEATLENLATALGYKTTDVSSSTLNIGDRQADNYRTIYVNVNGADSTSRKYTFHKCKINPSATHSYKKDGETLFDIEFEVLIDTTKTQGQRFAQIIEA
ncbi:MAG: hypothetical protein HN833_00590 [Elusimicrobiaceae bacterium]|jgi:hypothetical protein|nr:hypothetical protein [Elusimicrobiaceae bacterium]MBT3955133.1 hypothetical protein [Elusimicrobiaceae bacterium]MBT4007974.1 hypothetical protein [Elusimicrobiaceae bacterium]MBT4402645.1 hypothetical protein [Elusimicrobiaceae bacterium]MBT4440318.1 hypothetical protein [Elusimicrobiaceae bacterium]